MIKRILFVFSLLISFVTNAQTSPSIDMADAFYAEGKIYVVITVLSIVLIGLLAYLVYIDRKVKSIEKEVFDK